MKSTISQNGWSIGKSLLLATLIVAGSIGSAQAGPGNGNGNGNGKPTDPTGEPGLVSIIGDANLVCTQAPQYLTENELILVETACNLMANTDGHRDGVHPKNCTADADGNPMVIYSGANCDNNEDTLRRDAGSVVTALGDAFIESPAEGDATCPKLEQALVNIESYLATHAELTAIEENGKNPKLVDPVVGTDPETNEDIYLLKSDADDIYWGILGASVVYECGWF